MGLLYDVETHTVNSHLKQIFADSELQENSVIRHFRITAADGKSYDTQHYNLAAIIAVGYKVNSERAVQFRKWATGIIEQFTIKGYAMDDERQKNDGSKSTTPGQNPVEHRRPTPWGDEREQFPQLHAGLPVPALSLRQLRGRRPQRARLGLPKIAHRRYGLKKCWLTTPAR